MSCAASRLFLSKKVGQQNQKIFNCIPYPHRPLFQHKTGYKGRYIASRDPLKMARHGNDAAGLLRPGYGIQNICNKNRDTANVAACDAPILQATHGSRTVPTNTTAIPRDSSMPCKHGTHGHASLVCTSTRKRELTNTNTDTNTNMITDVRTARARTTRAHENHDEE